MEKIISLKINGKQAGGFTTDSVNSHYGIEVYEYSPSKKLCVGDRVDVKFKNYPPFPGEITWIDKNDGWFLFDSDDGDGGLIQPELGIFDDISDESEGTRLSSEAALEEIQSGNRIYAGNSIRNLSNGCGYVLQ